MKIAISPCPNDTYLFHAWIAGIVGTPPEVTFADIEKLNQEALNGHFPLIKLSFNCLKDVIQTYQLLPIGSALGFNCGPKIISKTPFPVGDLSQKRIAIPGQKTTAHLLLEHLLPKPKEKHFCLYHEVAHLIDQDVVDCGLIIHETRFTFAKMGFCEIIDLGQMWHHRYNLHLPLGALAVRRDFSQKESLLKTLQASLAHARSYPESSRSFILQHSQDKAIDVVDQHIATYVNQQTEHLSDVGIQAIETLTGLCLKNLLYLPKNKKLKQVYAS